MPNDKHYYAIWEEHECVWCGEIFVIMKGKPFSELEEYDYLLCYSCTLRASRYEQFVRSLGVEYNHLEYLREMRSKNG